MHARKAQTAQISIFKGKEAFDYATFEQRAKGPKVRGRLLGAFVRVSRDIDSAIKESEKRRFHDVLDRLDEAQAMSGLDAPSFLFWLRIYAQESSFFGLRPEEERQLK